MANQLTLLDEDIDDLFALRPQTCADCGATFETSRRASRCALCASLRSGQVGPATVVCPVCDLEHQIPILAPHKLCGPCRVDLVMTLASARARLEDAQAAADRLSARLDADAAHADDATRARFEAAVTMLVTGQYGGRQLTVEQVKAAWAKAKARGDDLAALLALYDAAAAAALKQQRAAAAAAAAEEACGP
jgi:hypothetical protein